MKNVYPRFPTLPFAALLVLATASAEILLASDQVIGYRSKRMLKSSPTTAEDRREFELMGSEKIEVAVDSSQAMISLWMTMWAETAGRMLSSHLKMVAAFASLASSRTPIETVEHQMTLSDTITDYPTSPVQLADNVIQLAGRGLAPVHSVALANAERFRRV